jgi:hypothetical protein
MQKGNQLPTEYRNINAKEACMNYLLEFYLELLPGCQHTYSLCPFLPCILDLVKVKLDEV